MNTTSFSSTLLAALVVVFALLNTAHAAQGEATALADTDSLEVDSADDFTAVLLEDNTPLTAFHADHGQSVPTFQQAIAAIESSHGAYGSDLPESLAGLARALQQQGRHDEAVSVFKRGVHLTRINEGLYCPQQIPLLQGEIESHKAARDYAQADERQNYLYRVQQYNRLDDETMLDATMEQARWQYDAYRLGLDARSFTRLMAMSDLYQQAAREVIEREGDTSPRLLQPLQGMLHAQYLISAYDLRPAEPVLNEGRVDEELLRFRRYHSASYQQGNAVIDRITRIAMEQATPDAPSLAEAMVMLGDWRLWNGRTGAAWEAYRSAETELARDKNAQPGARILLNEPTALPDLPGFSFWPYPEHPNDADVTLAFGVTDRGRVRDVKRLDDTAVDDRQVAGLVAQLRKTRFRPRFEGGQPIETDRFVQAYNIVP